MLSRVGEWKPWKMMNVERERVNWFFLWRTAAVERVENLRWGEVFFCSLYYFRKYIGVRLACVWCTVNLNV